MRSQMNMAAIYAGIMAAAHPAVMPKFAGRGRTGKVGNQQRLQFAGPVGPRGTLGRNDPCECGSGKKAKKCCRARSKPAEPIKPPVPYEVSARDVTTNAVGATKGVLDT